MGATFTVGTPRVRTEEFYLVDRAGKVVERRTREYVDCSGVQTFRTLIQGFNVRVGMRNHLDSPQLPDGFVHVAIWANCPTCASEVRNACVPVSVRIQAAVRGYNLDAVVQTKELGGLLDRLVDFAGPLAEVDTRTVFLARSASSLAGLGDRLVEMKLTSQVTDQVMARVQLQSAFDHLFEPPVEAPVKPSFRVIPIYPLRNSSPAIPFEDRPSAEEAAVSEPVPADELDVDDDYDLGEPFDNIEPCGEPDPTPVTDQSPAPVEASAPASDPAPEPLAEPVAPMASNNEEPSV